MSAAPTPAFDWLAPASWLTPLEWLALLSLLVPALGGALTVCALRSKGTERLPRSLCVPLGAVLGVGVASFAQLVWLYLRGRASDGIVWLDVALLAAGLLTWGVLRVRRPSVVHAAPRATALDWLLHLLLLAVALGVLARSWAALIEMAHGGWDAWAIWNLRARFLVRGGTNWRDAFSPIISYSHPDYPLLIPLTVVRGWAWTGGETTLVPRLVAGFFSAALGALVYGALRALRGRTPAALGAALVLVTPLVVSNSTIQYADLPVGLFLFAGLALLLLADRYPVLGPRLVVLSGLAFGMAAWTKNEGLLFTAAVLGAQGLVLLRTAGLRAALRRLVLFGGGLAPALLFVVLFKLTLATPSDLAELQQPDHVQRALLDPSRYLTILRAVGAQAMSASGMWGLPVTLLAAAGLMGLYVPRSERTAWATVALTLPLICAGFVIVYVLTPYDLSWHLSTSLDRLLLQLWPSFVLLILAAVAQRPTVPAPVATTTGP